MDADKDGRVNAAEFAKIADRIIQAYGLDGDDRRARALRAVNQMYWMELVRHSGAESDALTKDRFVMANRLAAIDTSRINVMEGLAHASFDIIDANGDNEIDKDEFLRFQRDVWQVQAPEAMEVFGKVDIDGDGAISRMEFVRTVREYFMSMDPSAPGSMLFGRV
ncbi:calcium-binding protein [Streptomyces thermolilacinus SPC6]|uniref:Calcium-binding protein n=1 Tax=Streptomyces thermolilacinus SPC6 TaxID=1306406 RepID=A0A1D3E0I2_9ACTN|nr:calcium-binding protein [Streptomyces thermolilacinus SPC6]